MRQAILGSDANRGFDSIKFSIGIGTQTISLATTRPIMVDADER